MRYWIAIAGLLTLPIQAEAETAPTPGCAVTASSSQVKIVVCDHDLEQASWLQAGKQACSEQELCNAWIWNDTSHAPATAPETDGDFAVEHSSNAVAVWINDSGQLILLRRTGEH